MPRQLKRAEPGRKKLKLRSVISKSPGNGISRIMPTVAHAIAVFGDERKASHWLLTPLSLLDNRTPSQVLDGDGGIEAVERILTRIEHNIPS